MKLNKKQIKEIEAFIRLNSYDFNIASLFEEYKKFQNYEYISHSFKKVIENFPDIFKRK